MNRTHRPHSQPSTLLSLLAFVLIIATIPVAIFLNKYRVAYQQAAGIYYASPGDNLTQKVSALQPGDTLLLNDGVYHTSLYIENKAGTATAPITIKAANDGKAIIDGGGNTGHTVYITNSSYLNITGLVVHNAQYSVFNIWGPADHITVRRVTAYDAGPGNNQVFTVNNGASNILFEDCAGWGYGRYIFIAYHSSNVTFRRTWAYQAYTTNFTPAPRSTYSVYGSSNVTLENVIGINTFPTQADDNYYTSTWETADDTTNYPTNNTQILGSLFYNDWEGYWLNGSAGTNTQIKDVYVDIPKITSGLSTKNQGDGIMWGTPNGGSISNVTFANNVQGFYKEAGTPGLTNSVFVNDTRAINGDPGHSYLDFWNNGSNGTSLNSTDKSVNPGYDTTTYGRGAYLFVPQNSPLKGAGQAGSDIGANILYEYVNGQLTNTPLWPWPMEDRIMAEKGISVTWEANGGIWKTLNGVYPNMTGTPTPNATPIATLMPTPTPTPSPTPSASPTATSTSSASPTPTSTAPYYIYGDSLASGWVNKSHQSSINFANTSPVYAGTHSIAFTANAGWATLYLQSNSSFDTTPYTSLRFFAQATQPNQHYVVSFVGASGKSLTPVLLANYGGDPIPGTWKEYTIPLTALGVDAKQIKGIFIQNWTSNSYQLLYVDSIALV